MSVERDPRVLGDYYCWTCANWQSLEAADLMDIDELVRLGRSFFYGTEQPPWICANCGGEMAFQIHSALDFRIYSLLGEGHRERFKALVLPVFDLVSQVLEAIPEGQW